MGKSNTYYDGKCVLHNTEKEQDVEAEILDFKPQHRIVASIERTAKITLFYNDFHSVYIGNAAGMEFTTQGPKEYNATNQR